MSFNSYIFILLFFPVFMMIYYLCFRCYKPEIQMILLLIASFMFYAYQHMEYLPLLCFSIASDYAVYRMMIRGGKYKKFFLISGILLNLGILFYFKYYNFFIDNLNLFLQLNLKIHDVVLPMGISFIVFQQIAFLVDTYMERTLKTNLLSYSVLISYFPHVSSGPILVAEDFLKQLPFLNGKISWESFASGLYIFVMGLGKKVLVADAFAKAVDWGYGNIAQLNSTSALFVSIAYSVQIYFDFSGYSDMAMGISRMLQIEIPNNFNSPYKANTISDFWDRWHISLTKFLTKYVYIPLGGNRKGKWKTYINIMIVFVVSGLWHGANWTFVVWGTLHGLFMVVVRHYKNFFEKIPLILNKVITLIFVNLTWILFRAGSFHTFRDMMLALLKNDWGVLNRDICDAMEPAFVKIINLPLPYWFWTVIILFVVLTMIFFCKNVQEKAVTLKYSFRSAIWVVMVAIISLLSLSGVSSFVYELF